jgi:serine/threonine protein kinase
VLHCCRYNYYIISHICTNHINIHKQIALGIKHLHSLNIVHRDIKPHNILLAWKDKKVDQTKSGSSICEADISKYILKISDMGLSKKFEMDDGSNHSTNWSSTIFGTGRFSIDGSNAIAQSCMSRETETELYDHLINAVGTIGWQAPELISGRKGAKYARASADDRNGQKVLATKVDVFALGCVFHYVLVPGEHPFGSCHERQCKIQEGRCDLSGLECFPEAWDLVSRMINDNPRKRPNMTQVCDHVLFWTAQKKVDFLCELSDVLESPLDGAKVHSQGMKDMLVGLESNAKVVFGSNGWKDVLDSSLLVDLGRYRKYDYDSVRDCLRMIRNKKHHLKDLPEDIRSVLSTDTGFVNYFMKLYPKLLLHCVKTTSCKMSKDEPIYAKYCSSLGRMYMKDVEVGHKDMDEVVVRGGSALADMFQCRGWYSQKNPERDSWTGKSISSLSKAAITGAAAAKTRINTRKYKFSLCANWEESKGEECQWNAKCICAHGPLELRASEEQWKGWGKGKCDVEDEQKYCDEANEVQVGGKSGGIDILGAAKNHTAVMKASGSGAKTRPPGAKKGGGKSKVHATKSNA